MNVVRPAFLLRSPFRVQTRAITITTMASAQVASPNTHAVPSLSKDYQELCKRLTDVSALGGISGLLGWDELVMMPPGAADSRAKQKSVLAGVIYEKQTDAEIGRLLERIQSGETASLGPYEQATVREAARDYKRQTALTKELAERKADLESRGYAAWVKARQASDFSLFAPVLQEIVDLLREEASLIDSMRPPYDVCLEAFEKGMTSARLDEIFMQVRQGLIPLLADVQERGTAPDDSWLKGTFDTKTQADLCEKIALDIGFDTSKGRLDVSVHPFTGGAHPTDVRMTTRFKEHDVTEGLTGAIHETGHALYEQGRNLEHDGLPVSQAMSMGIHESQSLLWERMVALSEPFADYLLPKLREAFPQLPANKSPADLFAAVNVVRRPSLIRVEADELTYPLHIILRYELEKGLIEGTVKVEDLPQLWCQRMKEYLGAEPENDAQGVLQDVHWSAGAIGYFGSYTLGAMCACQIYQRARVDLPNLDADIAAGKFSGLKSWLNEHLHKLGSLYPSGDELMKAVTGKELDPSIFLDHLNTKYRKLYGV